MFSDRVHISGLAAASDHIDAKKGRILSLASSQCCTLVEVTSRGTKKTSISFPSLLCSLLLLGVPNDKELLTLQKMSRQRKK